MVTEPTNHVSEQSPFNAKHKQGSFWYHLFTTFGMLRLGIEPTIFHTQSGGSTTEPPGPVCSVMLIRLRVNLLICCIPVYENCHFEKCTRITSKSVVFEQFICKKCSA